jgi:hypothetical protein
MPRSNSPSAKKVRTHRAKLRAAGLRPAQIWVRDTRAPGFAARARRQALAVAAADRADKGLWTFMDTAWKDLD